MDATVATHIKCINDIISVKAQSILTYWRCESCLQQLYLVIIDVNALEEIFQSLGDKYSRLKHLVDAYGTLTDNNLLLVCWISTIVFLRHYLT